MLHALDSPLRMHLEHCYLWYFFSARHLAPRLVLPCAHSFSDLALQDGTAEVIDQELVAWQTGRFGGEEAYIAAGESDEIDVALRDRSRGVGSGGATGGMSIMLTDTHRGIAPPSCSREGNAQQSPFTNA